MSTAGHAGPRRFRGFLREPEPAWGSTAVVRGVSAGEGAGKGGHTEGVERAAGAGKADDAGAASTLVFDRGPPHVDCVGRVGPLGDLRRGGGSAGVRRASDVFHDPSSKEVRSTAPVAGKNTAKRNGPIRVCRNSSRASFKPVAAIRSFAYHNSASESGPSFHHCSPATGLRSRTSPPNTNCTWDCIVRRSASGSTRTARSLPSQ